jgi:hypothetical protein
MKQGRHQPVEFSKEIQPVCTREGAEYPLMSTISRTPVASRAVKTGGFGVSLAWLAIKQ